MKRKIIYTALLAIVIALVGILPGKQAHADIVQWQTVNFEGTVTRPNGTPVPNVMVIADCTNGPSGFTDATGHYAIQGSAHLCLGDTISIATYIRFSPNLSAQDSNTLLDGTATITTSPNHVNRADIRMGAKTIEVPEYGWIGGMLAVTGGVAAIAYVRIIRRRSAPRSL